MFTIKASYAVRERFTQGFHKATGFGNFVGYLLGGEIEVTTPAVGGPGEGFS